MRLATGCLTVVLGLACACSSPAQATPAPPLESHLACGASMMVSMVVDHGGSGRETRSPEEHAKQYGSVVGGAFSGKRKVVYRSKERVDVSFVDGEGRAKGVLSYGNHGMRGWWLEEGANCA